MAIFLSFLIHCILYITWQCFFASPTKPFTKDIPPCTIYIYDSDLIPLCSGQASWGIAWYINGTLIPRIVVERGYTYTFISEGGQEGEGQNFHPFYISDSRRGGFLRRSEAQQEVRWGHKQGIMIEEGGGWAGLNSFTF